MFDLNEKPKPKVPVKCKKEYPVKAGMLGRPFTFKKGTVYLAWVEKTHAVIDTGDNNLYATVPADEFKEYFELTK